MLARELRLPVIIHTREADEDTIAILRDEGGGEVRGVLHCFTGNAALADAGLALGFYVSLAGIITFPKAAELRETVRRVPLERLLVETDSAHLDEWSGALHKHGVPFLGLRPPKGSHPVAPDRGRVQ